MKKILAIGLLGGIGAMVRLKFINLNQSFLFPYITLLINLLGTALACFLTGYEERLISEEENNVIVINAIDTNVNKRSLLKFMIPVIITGFCGGLTTFSGFVREIHDMNVRTYTFNALLYMLLSLVLSLIFGIFFYNKGAKK